MELSYSSKVVRLAYWPYYYIPEQTTLCSLFWRCAFRIFAALLIGFMLGGYTVLAFMHPLSALGVIGLIILVPTVVVACNGISYYFSRAENKVVTLATEAFWGIKNKVCPVIRITE